jgi:hypothetical protein
MLRFNELYTIVGRYTLNIYEMTALESHVKMAEAALIFHPRVISGSFKKLGPPHVVHSFILTPSFFKTKVWA